MLIDNLYVRAALADHAAEVARRFQAERLEELIEILREHAEMRLAFAKWILDDIEDDAGVAPDVALLICLLMSREQSLCDWYAAELERLYVNVRVKRAN